MTSATEKQCEYCDGESNPKVKGNARSPKLLFCIRGRTLVMRALEREWLYPQWLMRVDYCPMCGRDLREVTR